MSVDRPFTRRSALAASGTLALAGGALTLAGCGTDSSGGPAPSAASAAPAPSATSAAPAPSATSDDGDGNDDPSSGAAGSATPAESSAGDDAALTTLATIPVGSAVSADAGGKPILVSQPTRGKVAAFSAICTHMGCTVAPAGKTLNCPCHGSVFDSATGKVLAGPAPAPLPAVAVHVQDGQVFAGAA